MKKLKVGLVGIRRATGYGELFMNHPRTEVTAICDLSSKHLEEAGREFKLKDSSLFSNSSFTVSKSFSAFPLKPMNSSNVSKSDLVFSDDETSSSDDDCNSTIIFR